MLSMVSSPTPSDRDSRLDSMFSVLADERRRQVLQYFRSTGDDVASVENLVDYAVERGGSGSDRERVALRFHHATLPKLGDAGCIEYDARSDTVRYREDPLLERVLDLADEYET